MTTSIDDGNLSIFDLVMLARNITLTLTRNSLTAATLSWVPPTDYNVYGGCVIILSTAPIDSSNYPIDGVKYNASQDVSFPSSVIGSAQVVYASYAQNGQDLKLSTILLYNLDPAKQYYASLHLCSPTLQYHTAGIQSYLLESSSGGTSNKPWDATGVVPKSSTVPVNPSIGQVYFNLAQMHVYMWSGTAWVQTSLDGVITGTSFPSSPKAGAFFYNLQNKILYGFDGTNWNVVPLEQNGTPLYSKLGIGTDGSLDEREALIQQLKLMLGWPSVCIELDAAAFDLAIDNAIAEFRRYADNAYQTRYVALQLFRSQSNYYLNDPQVGSDRIVNIMKIHRVNTLGLASFGGPNGVYAQTFLNQFSAGGTVDILSIHLMASMSEEFERIFAGNIMFSFDENSRELNIYRTLYGDERVLLECSMERTEQELMKDRYIKQWLKKWAKAELKHMLGMIRTKYSNGLPSANGGLSLNGDTLLSESQADFEECRRQIKDFEVGNGGVSIGAAPFMF